MRGLCGKFRNSNILKSAIVRSELFLGNIYCLSIKLRDKSKGLTLPACDVESELDQNKLSGKKTRPRFCRERPNGNSSPRP